MEKYTPRLKKHYTENVMPALQKQFSFKSRMQVPRLEKIAINQGVGAATADKKLIETALAEVSAIAGQKAVLTKSKKDISNFKLRANTQIGVRVTLRGDQMYEFLDRLISVALPRVRDFKGVNDKSFDGRGNYTLGIVEHMIFPEIDIDKITKINGLDITFVTNTNEDDQARALLTELGIPFRKEK